MILAAGSTTPIAIVPPVLKPPPFLPSPDDMVEGTDCEEEEACEDKVAEVATASGELVRVECIADAEFDVGNGGDSDPHGRA